MEEIREDIEDMRDQLSEVKESMKKDQNKQVLGKIMELKSEFDG